MAWAKLDDGFYDHPKTLRVRLVGAGLQACAISYCARHDTDGVVPERWVQAQLTGDEDIPQDLAEQLPERMVAAGLWERREDDFYIHDYLNYNPSKKELTARRKRDSKRKNRAVMNGQETP